MTVGELVNVHDFDYMIFRRGSSNFSVMSGADGTILYETADQTDALTAFEYCRDQMTNLGKSTVVKGYGHASHYPMSAKVLLDSNDAYQTWRTTGGPRSRGCQVRALNNQPIFELTGGAIANTINNFYLTHNQAGYTTSIIRFLDRTIRNQIHGCIFSDFTQYKGNCISMEILGTGSGLSNYMNHIFNCESNGFENFKYINANKASVGADYFISSDAVQDCDIFDAKRAIKVDGITGGQVLRENWENCTYQYNAANPLTSGEAAIELNSNASCWQWIIDNTMIWDLPAGVNMVNLGASTELMMLNSQPTDRLGGNATGIAKTKRLDYYTHAKGTQNVAATYNNRDYTITHNLGKIPKHVFVSVMNNDTNAILYWTVPKSLVTTTQFTLRFNKPPPLPNRAGVLNLDIAWEVYF